MASEKELERFCHKLVAKHKIKRMKSRFLTLDKRREAVTRRKIRANKDLNSYDHGVHFSSFKKGKPVKMFMKGKPIKKVFIWAGSTHTK
jgi:hypothetical protein